MTNVVLVKWRYGYLTFTAGTGKRKTHYLDLSRVRQYAAAEAAATALLTTLTLPNESITVGVVPSAAGDWPGDGYDIGDAVDTYGIDGVTDTFRCLGINTTIDKNGFAIPAPTFNTQADEYTVRITRWLDAITQGTVNGRTSASPTTDPLARQSSGELQKQEVPPFTMDGEILVGTWPFWECKAWTALTEVVFMLGSASLSLMTIEANINGIIYFAGFIQPSVTYYKASIFTILKPGDRFTLRIPDGGAGTGAQGLTIQYTGAPIFIENGDTALNP